jgi:hypothetical protein
VGGGVKRSRRWSDNDRHFGPFTVAAGDSKRLGAVLDTGGGEWNDRDDDGACLRMHAFRCTLIVELPSLLPRGREYGAVLIEDAVHFRYGPQTMDSSTEKSACWFVPWLNWRHVRRSLYGLSGEHHYTQPKGQSFLEFYEIEKACPRVLFEFDDYDGERIVAKTHIEEWEWRLGTGWFRWLSLFRRARVRRSLDIEFSKETGPRKGSWKGGTIGHGIDMQPGELHEAAFRRYCAEHRMTFVGPASLAEAAS